MSITFWLSIIAGCAVLWTLDHFGGWWVIDWVRNKVVDWLHLEK